MISNIINSALSGLSAFDSKMYESAQNISNSFNLDIDGNRGENIEKTNETSENSFEQKSYYFSPNQVPDLTTNVVNMMMAKRGYEANLNVLKTAEDMSKSVINIFS